VQGPDTVEGSLESIDGSVWLLRDEGTNRLINLDSESDAFVAVQETHAGIGGVLGAVVGGTVGYHLAWTATERESSLCFPSFFAPTAPCPPPESKQVKKRGLSTVLGALGGTLIGGAIGSSFRKGAERWLHVEPEQLRIDVRRTTTGALRLAVTVPTAVGGAR